MKFKYKPNNNLDRDKPFLFSGKEYCDALQDLLSGGGPKEATFSGLLLIAGATNSMKSQIARGLIYGQLTQKIEEFKIRGNEVRRPHLLTIEDPIEDWWAVKNGLPLSPWDVQKLGLDYTPRALGTTVSHDLPSLHLGLKSALRQSPTVVYVGETREPEDWKAVMRFAGTGHLIVTTSHAGSLSESFAHIFHALDVRTPADRREVASRVFGIVHLRRWAENDAEAIIPAVWRWTTASESALVANGLGSLLPNNLGQAPGEVWSIGRYGCFEKLMKGETEQEVRDKRARHKKHIESSALRWDLAGE